MMVGMTGSIMYYVNTHPKDIGLSPSPHGSTAPLVLVLVIKFYTTVSSFSNVKLQHLELFRVVVERLLQLHANMKCAFMKPSASTNRNELHKYVYVVQE